MSRGRTPDRIRILSLLDGREGLSALQIKRSLHLSDGRYEEVRGELLKDGLVEKYACRGGGLRLTSKGKEAAAQGSELDREAKEYVSPRYSGPAGQSAAADQSAQAISAAERNARIRILGFLVEHGSLSHRRLKQELNISDEIYDRVRAALVAEGLVEQTGKAGGGGLELATKREQEASSPEAVVERSSSGSGLGKPAGGVAGNDATQEVEQVRRAAEHGDAEAQYNLGFMYAGGDGVPQDDTEAVKWYRRAAEQSHAAAQDNLGFMYDEGRGVPQDYDEAAKWYRCAADQGFAPAEYNLGAMYQEGQGVPQDDTEAVKWFRRAADQGYADAEYNLGIMCEKGRGVPQNNVEALKWYRLAAEQGDADAQAACDRLESCLAEQVEVKATQAEVMPTESIDATRRPYPALDSYLEPYRRAAEAVSTRQSYPFEVLETYYPSGPHGTDRAFDPSKFSCSIEDRKFWADAQSHFQLTKDLAERVAAKIREKKTIPVFIPEPVQQRYKLVDATERSVWRKSWWYVPASMVALKWLSPLVIMQSGIYGITEPGGDEFKIVALFDDFDRVELLRRAPSDAHGSDGSGDSHWLELFCSIRDGRELSFHEFVGREQLGFHLLIAKAMIDVWWPTVEECRGQTFSDFPLDMFYFCDTWEDLLAWAACDRLEGRAAKQAEVKAAQAENELPDNPDEVKPSHTSAGGALLSDSVFLQLVQAAKSIAKASNKQELTPLLFLCAVILLRDKATGFKFTLAAENEEIVRRAAEKDDIKLIGVKIEASDERIPLSDDLRQILSRNLNSSVATFLTALLAGVCALENLETESPGRAESQATDANTETSRASRGDGFWAALGKKIVTSLIPAATRGREETASRGDEKDALSSAQDNPEAVRRAAE
jgi:TPR repeat protein